MKTAKTLSLPAVEVRQGSTNVIFSFAIDGKRLPEFAAISRISRPDGQGVDGYQRPEVLSHISEIRKYIESESPLIPNAVVLAVDSRVRFEPHEHMNTGFSRTGVLHIPLDSSW